MKILTWKLCCQRQHALYCASTGRSPHSLLLIEDPVSTADLALATADVVAAQMIYRVVQNCLQLPLPTAFVLEQNKVCMHDI